MAINGVAFGGFFTAANGSLLASNNPAQLALANSLAAKYFNAASYSALSTAQQQQVADAKAIRASQIGVIFPSTEAAPFKDTLPAFVLSPSYKFNNDLTAYASWQYGEKAGISQLTNGVSNLVRKEKTSGFETGFKSALLTAGCWSTPTCS